MHISVFFNIKIRSMQLNRLKGPRMKEIIFITLAIKGLNSIRQPFVYSENMKLNSVE